MRNHWCDAMCLNLMIVLNGMVYLYFFCLFFLETFLGLPVSPNFHMHSVSFWSERCWQLPLFTSVTAPLQQPSSCAPHKDSWRTVSGCIFSSFSKRYCSISKSSLLHPPWLFFALWPVALTPLSLQKTCSILVKISGLSIRSPPFILFLIY